MAPGKKRSCIGSLMLWLTALTCPAVADASEPDRNDILVAMKKASSFMRENVALRGGHVWVVSEDLERRWGEVPARPTQIWLQGGTESVGQVMLDAYEATVDESYLDAAREAADAIVYGQRPTGGWHYFIDFDPGGIHDWYESTASRYRFGYEEYRHYYGNATFDDRVTQGAARFLLRFYNLTLEAAYREPVLKALDFVLQAQYPNGLWPQRYPLRYEFAHDGFPDYTSFYTLNDGATQAAVELLLEAHATLGDVRYFDAARRAVEGLIAIQGPEGQAAWAEQYGPDLRPVAARTHEPAGYVVRESLGVIDLLFRFYLMTGDPRYLAPIPDTFDWLERINRESAAEEYPRPRYWEPGTNRPLYVLPTDERTPEGYGVFLWTTDPEKTRCDDRPCRGDGEPIVDVGALSEEYREIATLVSAKARKRYLQDMLAGERARSRAPRRQEDIADIITAMDARGAWVTDNNSVNVPNIDTGDEARQTVRGISTLVFVDRLSALIAALQEEGDRP
jgi:hypothetical protein